MQKSAHTGANNGLEFVLDTEAYDYGRSDSGNEGFSINVGHLMDIPIMRQTSLNLVPGQALDIGVTPTLINTTDGAKRRFSPSQRLCYFEDEISLTHFPRDLSYRYIFGFFELDRSFKCLMYLPSLAAYII